MTRQILDYRSEILVIAAHCWSACAFGWNGLKMDRDYRMWLNFALLRVEEHGYLIGKAL